MEEKNMKEVFIDAEYGSVKALSNTTIKLKNFSDYQIEKYRASLNEEKMNRYLEDLSSPLLDPKKAGPFLYLYIEARELYREGLFYSCVAMCRITAERMCKALVDLGNFSEEDKKSFYI